MKCKCCDNRIWVEENGRDVVQIFTKKDTCLTEIGIDLLVEDAESFIEDIQKEIARIRSCQKAISQIKERIREIADSDDPDLL